SSAKPTLLPSCNSCRSTTWSQRARVWPLPGISVVRTRGSSPKALPTRTTCWWTWSALQLPASSQQGQPPARWSSCNGTIAGGESLRRCVDHQLHRGPRLRGGDSWPRGGRWPERKHPNPRVNKVPRVISPALGECNGHGLAVANNSNSSKTALLGAEARSADKYCSAVVVTDIVGMYLASTSTGEQLSPREPVFQHSRLPTCRNPQQSPSPQFRPIPRSIARPTPISTRRAVLAWCSRARTAHLAEATPLFMSTCWMRLGGW